MSNHELKFWSDMLMVSPPARSVVMVTGWPYEPTAKSHHNTYIYALDLATGWGQACMTTDVNLGEARKQLGVSEQKQHAARNMAHGELIRLADAWEDEFSDKTKRGMILATYYIAQTQTVKTVWKQMGSIKGHWLALIYRFQSGATTMRPVYMSPAGHAGILGETKFQQWALDALNTDMLHEDSELSRQMRSGQELILAPEWSCKPVDRREKI